MPDHPILVGMVIKAHQLKFNQLTAGIDTAAEFRINDRQVSISITIRLQIGLLD